MKIRKLIALFILFSILCSAGFVTHAEQLTSSEGPVDYQLSFEEALAEINAQHEAITKPVFDQEAFKAKYAPDREPRDFILEIPEGPKTAGYLSVEQMKRDAYVLMYNLRKYYSLYDYYGGDEKFDAVLTEIEDAVTSAGEMDAQAFCTLLLEHLSFINDRHFYIGERWPAPYRTYTAFYREVAFGKIDGKYVNLETGKEVKRVDGFPVLDQLFRLSLSDDCQLVYYPVVQVSIPFLEREEKRSEGIVTEPADTLHVVYSDDSTQALAGFVDYRAPFSSPVEADVHETQGVPVLLHTKFDKAKQTKLMMDFLDAYRLSPSMVVDLRMHGGGRGWDVLAWFDSYTGHVTSGNRCSVYFAALKTLLYQKDKYGGLSSSEINMLEKRLQAIDSSHVLLDAVPDEFMDNPDRMLIVLTSKGTASAAEWFVDYGHNVENVLFVGDATAGIFENGKTYSSVPLTYSHIPIAMGTMVSIFPDEEYYQEGRGFLPDIWVPGTEAEELICGFLQKLQSAQNATANEESTPTPQKFAALDPDARYANDYLFLWKTLETDYPFLPYLKDKGVDVDEIRERYARRVNGIEDDAALIDCIKDLFAELNNTAHLAVILPWQYPILYSVYVLNPDAASHPYFEPWREALMDPGLSPLYAPPEVTTFSEYQADEIGYYREVTVEYYEDCKTLRLAIPTFAQMTVERDKDLIHDTILSYPDAENLVFDITGNSGGDDTYWIKNIVGRFGESYGMKWREFYRDTPLNESIIESMRQKSHGISELKDAPEWASSMGLDRYYSGRMTIGAGGAKAIRSTARRWVIVDENVYSSSEKFVIFCKQTGWATVVGRHTGGDGLGYSPVLVMLPDSGILIRFSNTAGETPDGALSVDGTEPDILLETEPLCEALLQLIRSQNAAN